jgi:hypothetical protein
LEGGWLLLLLLLIDPSSPSPPEEHETKIVETLKTVSNNREVNFFNIRIKYIMRQIKTSASFIRN